MPFHPPLRKFQLVESELAIKLVCVFRRKHPSAKSLKFGMRDDHFHQPFRKALPAMRLEHKHVGYPRKRSVVGYDSRESDLLIAFVEAKRNRVFDRPPDCLHGSACGPIGNVQKTVNDTDVQPRLVGTDRVLASLPMTSHARPPSCHQRAEYCSTPSRKRRSARRSAAL